MKKLKKLLIGALSFVLGAALTLVGTLAYLQDETDTAFNVQTVGSVYIEQYELERKGNEFVAFTKGKPADPAVYNAGNTEPIYADAALNWEGLGSKGANKLFADSIGNVVDHIVFVKNTGSNDAYIRTVIAIETPVGFDANKIHKNVNTDGITWETINNVDIDGVNYTVLVATYNEAVEGGKATAPSLLQLYLDPTTGNKDTALFGDTWDVLVVSQAMQTTGVSTPGADAALDVAFGNITATNTPWTRENDPQDATPPYVANTADELAGFLANGGSIVIAEDITIGSSMPVTEDTVLDLNGMTIDAAGTISGCPIMLKNGKLVVKNGTLNLDGTQTNVNGTYHTAIGYEANTELVVDNVTFKGGTAINGTWNTDGPLKLTISNSTFDVSYGGIIVSAGSTEAYAIINNCNVNAGVYAIFASQGSKVTVNGGNYSADTVISSMYAGTEITVNGGYFDGALSITNNGSLVVKGGTFTADPSAYVAEGYVVVENTVTKAATTTYTVLPIADEATFRLAMKKLDNIKLMGNISLDADETITIAEGDTKVIDLNGFTLGGISDDADKNDDGKLTSADNEVMFDVRGTLTVKNGNVVYQHNSDNFGWDACTEIFYVGFNGTLNVEKATLDNLGGSDMAYCIDLVNVVNVTVNVTNSTLKSTYIPVRVFNNSATGVNNVTIKSSTLSGKYAFWTQYYLDDGRTADQLDATLKYDIFNGTNTFESTAKPSAPVIAGFDVTYYFTANGESVVTNASDFKDSINDGGTIAIDGKLSVEDITYFGDKAATITGGTFSRDTASGNPLLVNTTEKVTFNGTIFESAKGSAVLATRKDGANIELNNCVFNNLAAPSTGNTGIQVFASNVTIVFNNCTFNNMPIDTNSSYPDNITLVFNECTFTWTGDNCPGMIKLANYVEADIDLNDCKFVYTTNSQYDTAKNFIDVYMSTGTTTIDFNNFEVVGNRNNDKIWKVCETGKNVTITATGDLSYTFNGTEVDFNTYLK